MHFPVKVRIVSDQETDYMSILKYVDYKRLMILNQSQGHSGILQKHENVLSKLEN